MLRPEPQSTAALVYAAAHSTPDDPVLTEIERQAEQRGGESVMQIAPSEGALLTFLARLVRAQRVLEVGTFIGYGTISLARGLAPGGTVLTLELDPEHAAAAQANVERAGVGDRVEVRVGPAAASLAALPAEPAFDMAFLDADKPAYGEYYELIVPRMRPGGLLVIDNVLLRGRVLEPDGDAAATVVDRLNARVTADARVDSVLLPVADGMTLVRVHDVA